eukprot:5423239-Amphidinium_carterae.1
MKAKNVLRVCAFRHFRALWRIREESTEQTTHHADKGRLGDPIPQFDYCLCIVRLYDSLLTTQQLVPEGEGIHTLHLVAGSAKTHPNSALLLARKGLGVKGRLPRNGEE